MKAIKQVKSSYLMSIKNQQGKANNQNLQISVPEEDLVTQSLPQFRQYLKNSPVGSQFPPVSLKSQSKINGRAISNTPKKESGMKESLKNVISRSSSKPSLTNVNQVKSPQMQSPKSFLFPKNSSQKANNFLFVQRKNNDSVKLKQPFTPKSNHKVQTSQSNRQIKLNGRVTPTHKIVNCQQNKQEIQLNQQEETDQVQKQPNLSQIVAKASKIQNSATDPQIQENQQNKMAKESEEAHRQHIFQTFQAMKFVQTIPNADAKQLKSKRLHLPKRPTHANCKTLILDLDETLVHCCDDENQSPDVIFPIMFPTKQIVNVRFYTGWDQYSSICKRITG